MKKHWLCSVVLGLWATGWSAAQEPRYLPAVPPPVSSPPVSVLPPAPVRGPEGCGAGVNPADTPDCPSCDTSYDTWGSAEFLLWWVQGSHFPPLATVGPAGSGGILGNSGVGVVLGGKDINRSESQGGRFTAGTWFDEDNRVGLEGSYLFLGGHTVNVNAGGDGSPGSLTVARPFINANLNAADSELVAAPGLVAGMVNMALSRQVQGAEGNFVLAASDECSSSWQILVGFRYFHLGEDLGLTENLAANGSLPGGGAGFGILDRFATSNNFYGGQVGVRGEWWFDRLFVKGQFKAALGETQETILIQGETHFLPSIGAPVSTPGGLLALATNSGRFYRKEFAVLPELTLTVGYQLTDCMRVFAGYTFLYLSDVARPGDQIDPVVNPLLLPTSGGTGTGVGPARPIAPLKSTDFWAQGLNFGVEIRF